MSILRYCYITSSVLFIIFLLGTTQAQANPALARQYNVSCSMCHAAFPKLNAFGEEFSANGMRMDGWKEAATTDTGDSLLNLLKIPSVAFRAQAFTQMRTSDAIDETGNIVSEGEMDVQAPYLMKIFSAAPLSDNMTYYFAGMMAEKGNNGELLLEDAWLQYDDAFNTGVGVTFGQFQICDFMFPRETRLTFQDFIPYRMADITYQRGAILSRDIGPLGLSVGVANGNGIEAKSFTLNSAGYQRPDHAFDNNRNKQLFAHVGTDILGTSVGLFASQGNKSGLGDTQVLGFNISGDINQKWFWFAQLLQTSWSQVEDHGQSISDASWYGGFAGLDFIATDRLTLSLLYNYADANDLDASGTIYEGINLNTISATLNYYLQRNVKAVFEANYDLLKADGARDGIGHDTQEHYLLAGIDLAF